MALDPPIRRGGAAEAWVSGEGDSWRSRSGGVSGEGSAYHGMSVGCPPAEDEIHGTACVDGEAKEGGATAAVG